MAQPPPYNRQASFSNLQALNPSGQPPGNTMDAEYNAIKTTLDATLANLDLIQNDDGTVANQSIGPAQLSPALIVGFSPPTLWATGIAYTASPASTVLHGTGLYVCLISHTSSAFATDLSLGRWLLIFDLSTLTFGTASQITVSSHGVNILTNVQTSLNNLEDNKAATSHTHTASQISDASTAGRAMLTAANVAAQQTLLGLGSLAFLSSVPAITAIPGQIAFTGRVPATVALTNNDLVPTGWSSHAVFQLNSSGSYSITGFGATTDGDFKIIHNVGNFNMTLIGNSASSAAANRIALPRPTVVGPGQAVTLQYDATQLFWRVLTPAAGTPPRGSFRNLRVGNINNVIGDAAPVAPNNQAYIIADEIALQDSAGNSWPIYTGVSVTVDGTVQNAANGTDGTYSLGASTWYSLWAIGNPATNTIASLISTGSGAPTLPTGYTFFARVGWMRTDGSNHFLKTVQYGRRARYSGTLPTIATGSNAGAAISVVTFVPSTATVIAVVPFGDIPAAGAVSVSPTSTTSPPTVNISNTTGAGHLQGMGVSELHLEVASVFYTSNSGAGVGVAAYGWEDTI